MTDDAVTDDAPAGDAVTDAGAADVARRLVGVLRDGGLTCAVAESLTGGLVVDALVTVPGASAVVRGAVVAYATELKHVLLGVDGDLLAREGAVHPEVARQMAVGARRRLGADVGLATTGVAGPDPQDGHPPGTVHVAVATGGDVVVRELRLDGGALGRAGVRAAARDAVLRLALGAVGRPGAAGPDR